MCSICRRIGLKPWVFAPHGIAKHERWRDGAALRPADAVPEQGLGGVGSFLEDGEAAGERGLGG